MQLIKIFFLFYLFCVGATLFAGDEHRKIILNQLKDLESLVGSPLFQPNQPEIKIVSINSKGEAVGWADFKNSDRMISCEEKIGWYWHPENGFASFLLGHKY